MEDLTIFGKIGSPTRLQLCPPGLALFNTTLICVTQYGHEAYVVASGEKFWGDTSDVLARSWLMVRPLTLTNGLFH